MLIKRFLGAAKNIAKALEVDDLALTEEADDVVDVGVIGKAKNIVVGRARLLLCYYHVFATKSGFEKVRKILILQGISALFNWSVFQKFQ